MIEQLNSLSIKAKVGQLFTIGIAGPTIDDETRRLLDEISPGGVCLFARNIRDIGQTRELLDEIMATLLVLPLLSVDQEGGLVDRLRRVLAPMPAASKIKNVQDVRLHAEITGDMLRMLGFNMDLAPVVDVIDAERGKYTNGLFSRTFGDSKESVVELASEFLRVLQSKGIVGCLKHFPGLGASRVDSHEELPSVDIPGPELDSVDQFPYKQLLKAGNVEAVMVAHAAFPGHRLQETGQNGKLLPSSLSKNFITTLLRGELGFDGLVITDDMEMGAIIKNYGMGDACKMAIKAGVDQLAICAGAENIREGFHAVLSAVNSGEIVVERIDQAITRIERVKKRLSQPTRFDPDRLAKISSDITVFANRINS